MMHSPSQQAYTQQQSLASWAGSPQPDPELHRFLRQQQRAAEREAQAQQSRLRYLGAAGMPSPALQEALNDLTRALQNAARAAWQAGDLPAYWRRQEEIARETGRYAARERSEATHATEEAAQVSRARLEHAEAARLPRQFRDSLRADLVEALQQAAQTALQQGETTLFWRREAEIARLQQRPDPFDALTRRIIGGPSGVEEAFAPLQILQGLRRDEQTYTPTHLRTRPEGASLTVRLELAEGLKAQMVEESSTSSLQLITRIVEGMG